MTLTFLYMMLFLKLPILALLGIVWWAVRQEPETAGHGDDGGSARPPHRRPPLPRLPRRGPHGSGAPPSPPRVRSVVARGRPVHR